MEAQYVRILSEKEYWFCKMTEIVLREIMNLDLRRRSLVVVFRTISRWICCICSQHFLWDMNGYSEKVSYEWNLIDLATNVVVIRLLVPRILKTCNGRLSLFVPLIVFEKSSKALTCMLKFNLRIFLRSYLQNQFSPQIECCITNFSSKFLI